MKKALMVLGAIFLGIIAYFVVSFVFIAREGTALDKESKIYVDAAIPAIASEWNLKELEGRASPELKKVITADDLEKLVRIYRKLGNLKEYKGSKGEAKLFIQWGIIKKITANYVAKADFDRGPAEIKVELIKQGYQWQLGGFHVNSKVFLEQ